ncbi:hypothetical protein AUR64_14500 [Haloprofundus marisrubri]|uniref:DUF998 domain-containing protein n=1 Tax=Haloprofundus marisrubri TaxID=1514971 RepID=A0A0W1R723_9EURY|nr:hypothetical protein AUR64_14500 [Haloprofundus marisrubri]
MDALAVQSGAVGLLVVYGSLLAAIVLSPTFGWTTSALSDLGAVDAQRMWIFNGGLILGGFLLAIFVRGIVAQTTHRTKQLGAIVLGTAYVLSIFVGVFPHPTPLHNPVALTQFALIPIGLSIYAIGSLSQGVSTMGLAATVLALSAFAGVGWLVTVVSGGSQGIALPELVVVASLDIWTLGMLFQRVKR